MQPFFTTKALGKGTGLGLSITKRLIEEHRGEFRLVTESEHTCFEVILPKRV
jgi:signal transduction histidine kinase